MEALVAARLTSRTLDLEVRGSSLARPIVSLDKKRYSTLFLFTLAPVVQKLDSAIHRINIAIQWISIRGTNCVMQWSEIYPVDSVIYLLNN